MHTLGTMMLIGAAHAARAARAGAAGSRAGALASAGSRAVATAAAAAAPTDSTTGTAGWPPGLHVFENFGTPTQEVASSVVGGARELIAAVDAAARALGDDADPRVAGIPQPEKGRVSRAHNLAEERAFHALRVADPAGDKTLRCEHFAEYGSRHHALTYFRGTDNIPAACAPVVAALEDLDVVKALGDELTWKLTLNDYKARGADDGALAEAGGALFPWHTDLAANGEITCISTLLAPAILDFAPHADLSAADRPTRVVVHPGTLVLLSGPARWDWVHRAMPHPDAAGKERISLVLGCAAA